MTPRPKPVHPRKASGILWRDGWAYLWVSSRVGRAKRALHTKDPAVAKQMRAVLRRMREEGTCWDLLDAARDGRCTVRELVDAEAGGHTGRATLRARLADVSLVAHLAPWLATYRANGGAESTANLYHQQVADWLAGHPNRTDLTKPKVMAWLTGRAVSSGTRRGYLYALRSFVAYLLDAALIDTDPLAGLKAPSPNAARTRHEDEATDRKLCDAAPAPYRALFALVHATGAEVSAALATRRRDLELERGVAHIHGTKNRLRDRAGCLIEPWALPILRDAVKGLHPDAKLWPGLRRQQAAAEHATARAAIGVTNYTLRDARHSWCIRALSRGATFHDLAVQLGHKDTAMVHRVYARFLPELDGRLARYRREATGPTDGPTRAAGGDHA